MNPAPQQLLAFDTDEPGVDPVRMTAWIRGRVQGVGMRWWVRARALELGLEGWALNLDDGRVEVVAEGPRAACRTLALLLDPAAGTGQADRTDAPGRPGSIVGLVLRLGPVRGAGPGFRER